LALAAALAGFLAGLLLFWTPQGVAFFGKRSPDGRYLAQIETRCEIPYLNTQVYLTIRRSTDGGMIAEHLLTARDDVQGALLAVKNLEWTAPGTVSVEQDAPNFTGRRSFTAPP
jgi:hypothetical protein